MFRSSAFVAAFALSAATAAAASYSATLASPTSGRVIAGDLMWNCAGAACQGATEESRPLVLCQSLAKRAGRVDSFLVNGRAFTADELGRCNAFAKRQAASQVAAQ